MLRNLAYRIPLILLPLLLVTSQIKRCNSRTMEHRLVNTLLITLAVTGLQCSSARFIWATTLSLKNQRDNLRNLLAQEHRGAKAGAVLVAIDPRIPKAQVGEAAVLAVGDVSGQIPSSSKQVGLL